MNKDVLIRRAICYVVSFFLCLFLFILNLCLVCFTAQNESYVLFAMKQSGYHDKSLETLKTELDDLSIPSGFELGYFASKINTETYNTRVKESFKSNLKGVALPYTTSEISDEFYTMCLEYPALGGEQPNDETAAALRTLSDECAKRYMTYSNPTSVKYIFSLFKTLKKALLIVFIVVLIAISGVSVFLYFLCRGRDLQKHIIFTLSGAALMSFVFPAFLLITGEIRKASLTLPALYWLTVNYAEGLLWVMIVGALLLLTPAIVLSVLKLKNIIKQKQAQTES